MIAEYTVHQLQNDFMVEPYILSEGIQMIEVNNAGDKRFFVEMIGEVTQTEYQNVTGKAVLEEIGSRGSKTPIVKMHKQIVHFYSICIGNPFDWMSDMEVKGIAEEFGLKSLGAILTNIGVTQNNIGKYLEEYLPESLNTEEK